MVAFATSANTVQLLQHICPVFLEKQSFKLWHIIYQERTLGQAMEIFTLFQSVITHKGFLFKNLKNSGVTEKLLCHLDVSDEPSNHLNTVQ